MKVVYNKFIPFPGFFAINLFGVMFVREEYKRWNISERTYNHESIHTEQMLDFVGGIKQLQFLGGCIFYILYFIEWLLKLVCTIFTFGTIKAYKSISFEQEAYNNDTNYIYLKSRKRFAWIKNIFKFVK
jgi:hypothetical protein